MKTIFLISKRPQALRKIMGITLALTGAGLALHAGLVTLGAFSASVAAALALGMTLLLAVLAVAAAARMAHAALRPEPLPLALPAARPWR